MTLIGAIVVGGSLSYAGVVFLPKVIPVAMQTPWWKAGIMLGLGVGGGWLLWKFNKPTAAIATAAVFGGAGITLGLAQAMVSSQPAPQAAQTPAIPTQPAPAAMSGTYGMNAVLEGDFDAVQLGHMGAVLDMRAVQLGQIKAVQLGAVELQMEDAGY